MKWGSILGIMVVVTLITLYEWPRMNPNQKKEKIAFVTVVGIGSVLAILLIFFPDMPGPTQMIHTMYKPLGKILEK